MHHSQHDENQESLEDEFAIRHCGGGGSWLGFGAAAVGWLRWGGGFGLGDGRCFVAVPGMDHWRALCLCGLGDQRCVVAVPGMDQRRVLCLYSWECEIGLGDKRCVVAVPWMYRRCVLCLCS